MTPVAVIAAAVAVSVGVCLIVAALVRLDDADLGGWGE